MKIAVVTPVYNEKKHLRKVLEGIQKFSLPIIVVDDGSTDLARNDYSKKGVIFLRHKINLGKGAAMKTGADYAFSRKFDAVIFMDSDGQHNASNLTNFIKNLETNKFDVIFGSRKLAEDIPFVRKYGNKTAIQVVKLLFNIKISDLLCGYRAITKKAYNKIRWNSSGYGVETEMIARTSKNNLRYLEVPVDTIYHDVHKGVTILDAFSVFFNVIQWRLSI